MLFWLKQHWEVVKAALGVRRFLLTPLIGSVIGMVDWVLAKLNQSGMITLVGVPSWMIGICVAISLVLWWMIKFAVKLRQQISGSRTALSRLRAAGVAIRNDGRDIFTKRADFNIWNTRVDQWEKEVVQAIREVNEADAEWFAILDVVPKPRVKIRNLSTNSTDHPNWQGDHTRAYNQHDARLDRLGDMIRNLWRD